MVYRYHIFFNRLSTNGHLDWSYDLAVVNDGAVFMEQWLSFLNSDYVNVDFIIFQFSLCLIISK